MPTPAEQLPAILGKLQTSTDLLIQRLQAMQARDPAKEFAYREGNINVAGGDFSFSKIDAQTAPCTSGTDLQRVFASQIYVKAFRFRFSGVFANVAATLASTRQWLIEIDDDLNFTRPQKIYLAPSNVTLASNNAVATVNTWAIWDYTINLKKRYLRMTLMDTINGAIPTVQRDPSGVFTSYTPLCVDFLGE